MPYKDPEIARRQSAIRMKEWRRKHPHDKAASIDRALELLEARAAEGLISPAQRQRLLEIVARTRSKIVTPVTPVTPKLVKPVTPDVTPVTPAETLGEMLVEAANVTPVAPDAPVTPEPNLAANDVTPVTLEIDPKELERQKRAATKATMAAYRAAKARLMENAGKQDQEHEEPT